MTHRTALLTLAGGFLLLAACSSPAATGGQSASQATAPGRASIEAEGIAPSAPPSQPTPTGPEIVTATTTLAEHAAVQASTACELITEQLATAALGTDPGPGQATPLGETASACTFIAGTSSLQLSLTPSGGKAVFDKEVAGIPAGTAGVTEVSGVGDGAFSQVTGTRAAINFDKGDALVVIGLSTANPPTQDQLITLATTAASRL